MRRNVLFAVFLLLFAFACTTVNRNANQNNGELSFQTNDALKKFESKQEIIDYLKDNQQSTGYDGFRRAGGIMAFAESDMAVKSAAPLPGSGSGAADYSTTNVQVEGVDEADFIKNDDKYIYMVVNGKLVIVDAYPAEDAELISETKIKGYPTNMFLKNDKVIVFTNFDDNVMGFEKYDIIPRPIYKQMTKILVYDVSDREDPKLVKDYDVKGYFVSARMIGDYVYLIAQDPVYYYGPFIDTPVLRESGKMIASPDVYYFDNPDDNFNFNTIMSLNVETYEANVASFMMGYANTIYVSEENIYIAYQKNMPWRFHDDYNEKRFREAVLPILPSEYSGKILSIYSSDESESDKWDKISGVLEEMYNSMDEDEKEEFIEDTQEAIEKYDIELEEERQKTIIHKINIVDGNIEYDKKGEVKGYLLNQFSLDEYQGNLRLATTFSAWANSQNVQYNNVYVLDEDLSLIGKEEKIAPEERIYSARFMGDKLYLVTFRQTDPFFVIDLSDAENPKVLGELKIPGFSEYLHPYDETHIIGIGKETGENEWGGVTTKGLKLALFDVSDFENPKLVDKYVFGDQGSDSESLNDHKAFLFSKEKNLLVIPATIIDKQDYDPRYGYYRQNVWQGAYAFDITLEGFELKGKIRHKEGDNYWDAQVRRSLYMDNVLYTVSSAKIVMNNLDDMEKIDEIALPSQEYYDEPMPYGVTEKGATVGSAQGEAEVREIVIE